VQCDFAQLIFEAFNILFQGIHKEFDMVRCHDAACLNGCLRHSGNQPSEVNKEFR
jgi:hypothetical protein